MRVEVSPDGTVFVSEQIALTVKCVMNFGRLPFDKHQAEIIVMSFGHDATEMRVVPRGGEVGSRSTGTGLTAPRISSVLWSFPCDEADDPEEGFSTPGIVVDQGGWDRVSLRFVYERRERYYINHVVIPCMMFLFVSYSAFVVDPAAAPARATLAVIPVLIMRTLSNSVTASFPQGSRHMWLDDFVYTSMFMCVVAACEYAVVMYFMQKQKANAQHRKSLIRAKAAVKEMRDQANAENITLWDVLQRYKCIEVTEEEKREIMEPSEQERAQPEIQVDQADDEAQARPPLKAAVTTKAQWKLADDGDLHKRLLKAAPIAVDKGVEESELTVLRYTYTIFKSFDSDGSGTLGPDEVRRAFTYFDIYKSTEQMATIMCMFLRDQGMYSPECEIDVKMKFSPFTFLLISIDEYALTGRISGSLSHRIIAALQSMSPAMIIDVAFRILFPVAIVFQLIIFLAILQWYPSAF